MSTSLNRRSFLRFAALAASASLAACAPVAPEPGEGASATATAPETAPSATTGSAEPAPAGKTRVEYWDTASPEDINGLAKWAIFDRYAALHPEIELVPVSKPKVGDTQMSETLITSIAAGTPPDAAWFDRFVINAWAAEGTLTDLTDLCASNGITGEDYFPFAWTEVSGWKAKVWALPYETDNRALFYNKKLFREAGLDPDNIPTDLETFDQWAEQLFKSGDGRMTQVGFIPWANQGKCPYVWGWTFGATYWTPEDPNRVIVNSEEAIASMEWRLAYANKYDIAMYDSFASASGSGATAPFFVDQYAAEYAGDWQLASIAKYAPELEFGVVPMPYPKGGRSTTLAGGWSLVIPSGAKHPAEAFDFLMYFGGPEEMQFYCTETVKIPTLKALAEDPVYSEDPMHKVFMDLLPVANSRPPVPTGQYLWTALIEARDLVVHGQKTPKQALDDVQAGADKEMERFLAM
ncbi:MAG: ABC transporter substrate-binding protein [Chloroflexi bacterium]|jgi:multiple sugar transport system substrate-binding protein|nr:ABC transporter substrate-binding protein [Chloroflexota bacterium]